VLLDHGADPNTRKEDLWTPLHLASANSLAETVELLLGRGADVHVQNIDGHTPYRVASRGGDQDILRLLSVCNRG
jgi:ankyrin repeat protein